MIYKKILLMLLLLLIILISSLAASCTQQVNWEERFDMVNLSYMEVKHQRDDARTEKNDLEVELADLKIKYATTLLLNITLKEDYKSALSYIGIAEYILEQQDIPFYYTGPRN